MNLSRVSYYCIPGLPFGIRPEILEIEEKVCNHLQLEKNKVRSPTTKREYVEARQIVIYLAKTKLKWTFEQAGAIYGKDHATAMYAVRTIKGLLETNKSFRDKVSGLIEN